MLQRTVASKNLKSLCADFRVLIIAVIEELRGVVGIFHVSWKGKSTVPSER
jgi:hypothetical protein